MMLRFNKVNFICPRLPHTHTISDAVSDNSPNTPSFTVAWTPRTKEMAQQLFRVIALLTNHITAAGRNKPILLFLLAEILYFC